MVRTLQTMTEVGAVIVQDAEDVGKGMLIAKVKDPDGSAFGLRLQS